MRQSLTHSVVSELEDETRRSLPLEKAFWMGVFRRE
jgi:hypothetical protein